MEPTGDNCTVWCIFPADKNPVLGNELIKIKAEPVWPGGDLYSGKLYNPGFWRGGIPIQLKITPDKIVSTSDNAKFSLTRYRQ